MVKSHLFAGNKHKTSKNSLARKEARERDIASYLTKHHREERPSWTSVSMEEHVVSSESSRELSWSWSPSSES